jgi:hypothetical protein
VDLDIRLIVPGPDRGTLLLTDGGELPPFVRAGDVDEASIVAVDRLVHGELSLPCAVLESHPQWAGVPEGASIPTLATTEPAPASWQPPTGLSFRAIPDVPAGLPASLVPRAREWLEDLRAGSREPPALRPRWSRPGWRARAAAWMTAAAADAGQPLTGEPQSFYLRGISALLRAPTAGRELFLKAVFPPFHAEPVLTELLAARFPGHLPRVLATEPNEGWLLLEDIEATLIGELPDADRPAALAIGSRAIVEIQTAMADRPDDLAALGRAGAPHRPAAEVPAALDVALGPDGVGFEAAPLGAERRARILDGIAAAVARIETLGVPETIVHGDFHPGNAAIVDGRAVIIDWSDAAIGCPVVDLLTWISWSDEKPAERQGAIDAWLDARSAVVDVDAAALRDRLEDILALGAAYQVISYDGILKALEPATRYTLIDGSLGFLKSLEASLERIGAPA